jgi:hypothetical protein
MAIIIFTKTQYSLLYDLAIHKDTTVSQGIGYNRFHQTFTKFLDFTLSNQLHLLYQSLVDITLNDQHNQIIWRWNSTRLFTIIFL